MENKVITNLRKYAYKLYKAEWINRISTERQLDVIRNYIEEGISDGFDVNENFEEYLNERGFDGELYCCYDEFIEGEYRDEDYMRTLFDNEDIFNYYKRNDPEFGGGENE
ncbi:hypothetical protein [Ruminococcus sp.]|jgi:hypothetical protein|uniref:hypothetical protein n=1 Tax=Ruminococcus sp. TaxID=41978 RepID=UPI00258F59BC|nr:hypothetical protein [Ruminococcus sp.]MCR5021472.1 hypothetical protein [Ruminococcus sp.]